MAVVNRKRLNTTLTNEHFEFLSEVCEVNKQKQSVVVEIALDLLKQQLKSKNLYEIMHQSSK